MKIENIKKRNYPNKVKDSLVDIPADNWIKCSNCKEIIYKKTYVKNLSICPYCNKYFRLSAKERLDMIIDKDSFSYFDLGIDTVNPLNIDSYMVKLDDTRNKTGMFEGVITGKGSINGNDVVIAIMDSNFFMGSMGSVLGEYITNAIDEAIKRRLPLIIFSTSGGARMQEGIISLMQMAKTTSELTRLDEEGLLYISVLTDPTYGGVTASFASLGDIILAEPGAMIGFAGQNVIKQTIGEKLPKGFQTAEFMLEHGFVDKIVERKDMKETISMLIELHKEVKK